MKTLKITVLLVFLAVAGYSQKKQAVLIADETTMTQLSASVKIETSNERIFKLITDKFGSILTGYSVKFKKDRAGAYKEYSIPFKNEYSAKVLEFVKSLNK